MNKAQKFLLDNQCGDLLLNEKRCKNTSDRIYSSDIMMKFKGLDIVKSEAIAELKSDYVETLESLVCFYAAAYNKAKKTYRDDLLAKGDNITDAEKHLVMSFLLIQGIVNQRPTNELAGLNSKLSNKLSMSEVVEIIKERNSL